MTLFKKWCAGADGSGAGSAYHAARGAGGVGLPTAGAPRGAGGDAVARGLPPGSPLAHLREYVGP